MKRAYIAAILAMALLFAPITFSSDKGIHRLNNENVISTNWNDHYQQSKHYHCKHQYHRAQKRIYRPGAPKRHVQRYKLNHPIVKKMIGHIIPKH